MFGCGEDSEVPDEGILSVTTDGANELVDLDNINGFIGFVGIGTKAEVGKEYYTLNIHFSEYEGPLPSTITLPAEGVDIAYAFNSNGCFICLPF